MASTTNVDPQQLLQERFGFDEFREGQLDVIQRLLDGHSVLSVFPTGGGKSLCFQLPALAFDGLTVIVSPLIALMKDQIDQLESRGIRAVRLDSSLTNDEYRSAMDSLRSGEAKMLYVAPERFFNERFRNSLQGITISLFAIDEAHCISQWGHNFRPDYLKLASIAEKLQVQRVLALTATATPAVQDDICAAFEIQPDNVICTEFFRPNLHIRSQVVTESSRIPTLIESLKSGQPGATIVYVTLQKTAEQIANACTESGLNAKAYHAGMQPEDRNEIQEWFMNGEQNIVVATIAFGMGIDKSDIRRVYHFNPPKSIENYAQEIGRAGRDGKTSQCELMLLPADQITLENFVYGDTPSRPSLTTFLKEIARQENEFFISQYTLGGICDIKPLVLKTLLTWLELDEFLESTSPRYDGYSFKPNVASNVILDAFEGERQQFVRQILSCSKKAKTWFSIDLPNAMNKIGCDRSRIVKALDYIAERGWIELRTTGLVHGYRKLQPLDAIDELSEEYATRIEQREQAEIDRIKQVLDLAKANSCLPGVLSAHFGQPLDNDCGTCTYCIGEGDLQFGDPPVSELPDTTIEQVKQLITEHPAALNSSRAITRFLCGLTSPALTRAKLSRHDIFGTAQEIPFASVRQQVERFAGNVKADPPF